MHYALVFFRLVSGFFDLLENIGVHKRTVEKRRQGNEVNGCWADNRYINVGETFGGDGCTEAKCTCLWDGTVSCHQGGTECKFV